MTNHTIKAVRTTIHLGNIPLDVYLLPDGTYRLSQSQALEVVNEPNNWISRLQSSTPKILKALTDKGFTGYSFTVTVEKTRAKTLSIEDARIIWRWFDKRGNDLASAIIDACVDESIERRADAAFGVQRSEEERQSRMKERIEGKIARRSLTDAIKDYIERNNITGNTAKWMYFHVSETLNRLLFGMPAKKLCEKYQCPKDTLRDQFESKDIVNIRRLEEYTMQLIDKENTEPIQALTLAHEFWVKQ